ncbi:MAG: HAD-IIB family hydrolase [Oscillospiraceae bacterium]|nr:HAD-IIB family hydrolase [Oscillospiraceae bacterium]
MRDFSGCILACDVDGTLVSGDILPKENIIKIAEFTRLGGIFSLATGRSIGALGAVLSELERYIGPSVVANGCMIYDFKEGKILGEKTIPDSAKIAVFEASGKFDQIGIEIHSAERTFIFKDHDEVRDHQSYEGLNGKVAGKSEVAELKWNKALFASPNEQRLSQVDEFFEKNCKEARCVPTNADIYGRIRHYREILPLGVNKASTLSELCKMLGIKKGGFFAIGDYFNDIQMLSAADISACPEGSPDEVKEQCDFMAKKASDGAVADFIDYLMSKEI